MSYIIMNMLIAIIAFSVGAAKLPLKWFVLILILSFSIHSLEVTIHNDLVNINNTIKQLKTK